MQLLQTACALSLLIAALYVKVEASTTEDPGTATTVDSNTPAESATTEVTTSTTSGNESATTPTTSGNESATTVTTSWNESETTASTFRNESDPTTDSSMNTTMAPNNSNETMTTAATMNTCYSCNSSHASCSSPVAGTTPTCTGNICFSIIDGVSGSIKRDCMYNDQTTCSSDNTGSWAGTECYYCCTSNLCNTIALSKDTCNTLRSSASIVTMIPVSLMILLSVALQRLYL